MGGECCVGGGGGVWGGEEGESEGVGVDGEMRIGKVRVGEGEEVRVEGGGVGG